MIVETRTRLRLDCGEVIEAAPGSRVLTRPRVKPHVGVGWVKHRGIDAVELRSLTGQVEIPLRLAGMRFLPLLVAAAGSPQGDLRFTQRRGDGRFSAGYGVNFR